MIEMVTRGHIERMAYPVTLAEKVKGRLGFKDV